MRLDKKVEQVKSALDLFHQRVKELNKMFVYSRFDDNKPQVAVDGGGDIWLVYQGFEMSIETALDYMKDVGYITPDDFFLI